jgi:two-component sensor histidine kinase
MITQQGAMAELEIATASEELGAVPSYTTELPIPSHGRIGWNWRSLAILFGGWTLFGIFGANEWYFFIRVTEGRSAIWSNLLKLTLPGCWLWALMTIALMWLVRVWPITRRSWKTRVPVYLALGLVSTVLDVALDYVVEPWVKPGAERSFLAIYIAQFEFNFAIFIIVAAVRHAIGYSHQARDRQVRAAQLETQLTRAKLKVLKMQLQPHFLFNTLGAISELVHQDADRADRVVARLGDLLRATTADVSSHEVSLAQELDFVEAYLEIQRARFGERLAIGVDVPRDTLDALVPSLSLQPLVENAIIHGIAPRCGPGRIDIRARRDRNELELLIEDDGLGPSARTPRREGHDGIGLSTTRERLRQLYGRAHVFTLAGRAEGGTRVTMRIPLRFGAS